CELRGDFVRIGRGQVDLVHGGQYRQPGVAGQVEVRQRLRLDPLGRVDQEDRPLTRREAPRHLVGEVDVPGRVDQVQLVLHALARVREPYGLGLDGDAALALQVHPV